MIYHKEHSIVEAKEKETASGGTSAEDKARIAALEAEIAALNEAIERGLTT